MHGDGSRYPGTIPLTPALVRSPTQEIDSPVWPATQSAGEAEPELPEYLVRHYWWAYLWPPSVWFFDHQPIVNGIVFGQYRRLVDETMRLVGGAGAGETLMIASAYGNVIPRLAAALDGRPLTVVDVAPIQLERARIKLERADLAEGVRLLPMNAERLRFGDDSHDTALFFLLLHELPPEPRRRAVSEALRVLRPGGRLVLAEYGAFTRRHWFHRLAPLRWIFGTAEPFLPSLWKLDLDALLAREAAALGKRIVAEEKVSIFRGFYRVHRYRVESP